MIRVFIGYDPNETVAYHVLAQSIMEHSSVPVSITPLKRSMLPEYTRPRASNESTEFSMTRFLVPHLCNYEGYAIFMDCDMLCMADIEELWRYRSGAAVSVAKHVYVPKTETKFLGQEQTKYEKKNWSSVMLFNNKFCRRLTPEYVNTASGLDLHQFKWLNDDDRIGSIPLEWNYLVGEYDQFIVEPKLIHYTLGGPYFKATEECEYAKEWFEMFTKTVYAT